MVEPAAQRAAVAHLRSLTAARTISERRAYRLVNLARATCRYRPHPKPDDGLTERLQALSAER